MPSYYDSTKKKPGTAKVKYEKGGKVRYDKGGKVKRKESGIATMPAGPGPDAPGEWVDHVNEKWGPLGKILTPRTTITKWAINKLKEKKKKDKPDKMAKGGQVRGMGAASRGGNFSRNG